ncbi:hypothetical protein [Streptomyces sp. CB03911]|uniref:hypothetical protein n=1 Tax=Streptomyces sp. CB03911 TaxID=1804758 RepID=UPI0009613D2D|nr:hypothetical protein [Streptomyces sp. CB03911]OKI25547.1 hypothetical protein A6A07_30190 [Streptomyces sp. CB03911]
MVDVLTWVMQRRLVLAARAERLREELADLDVEVVRLEAAEMVFGQFADAQRVGQGDEPAMAEEFERVTSAPGAGGMLLVPHREDDMDTSALPADHQAIMKIVAAASEAVPAKDVNVKLGRGTGPWQVEPVRDKLKRLADRGWLHRTPAGRFTGVPQSPA